jgi:hypothetical protein
MNNTDVVTALCSVADAARLLDKPVRTVQNWARTGRLATAAKLSGKTGAYVIDRAEIEALVEQQAGAK